MTTRFDLADPEEREAGLTAAVSAVRRGQLIVLPTDTVYGIGVDAFDADGVQRLLDAKGRGRDMPPPVLISASTTLEALATELPGWATGLVEKFWPGPLTIVCRQQPSLRWDLGEARGTVAVRMPDHDATLELLGRTGPLAVSSANTTGAAGCARRRRGRADAGRARGGRPRRRAQRRRRGLHDHRLHRRVPRILRAGALGHWEVTAALEALGADLSALREDDDPRPDTTDEGQARA